MAHCGCNFCWVEICNTCTYKPDNTRMCEKCYYKYKRMNCYNYKISNNGKCECLRHRTINNQSTIK